MKWWHYFIFFGGVFFLWSFSKGFAMTGRLKPALEMFVLSLLLMIIGLVLRAEATKKQHLYDDVLDDGKET